MQLFKDVYFQGYLLTIGKAIFHNKTLNVQLNGGGGGLQGPNFYLNLPMLPRSRAQQELSNGCHYKYIHIYITMVFKQILFVSTVID